VITSFGLSGREIMFEKIPYNNAVLLKTQIVLKDMKGLNFCTRVNDNAQLAAMIAELRAASGNHEMDGSSTRHFDYSSIQNADVIRCGYLLYLKKTHSARAICAAILDLSQDSSASCNHFRPVPVFDTSEKSMDAKLAEFTRIVELLTPKTKAVTFLNDPFYAFREPIPEGYPIRLSESTLEGTKQIFRPIKPIGLPRLKS